MAKSLNFLVPLGIYERGVIGVLIKIGIVLHNYNLLTKVDYRWDGTMNEYKQAVSKLFHLKIYRMIIMREE